MYLTYVQLFDGEFIKRSIITANAAHRWRIPCSVIKTIPLLFQDDTASSFRVKIFCEDGLGKGGSHTQDKEVPLCEACLQKTLHCSILQGTFMLIVVYVMMGETALYNVKVTYSLPPLLFNNSPTRSGLLFPVGKLEQQMRRSKYTWYQGKSTWMKLLSPISGGIKRRRLGECAPVYLAAVIHSALKIWTSSVCFFWAFSCFSHPGVGIHDGRAGGGGRAAGEEGESEEQEAGSAHDQPKPHCAGGEWMCSEETSILHNFV